MNDIKITTGTSEPEIVITHYQHELIRHELDKFEAVKGLLNQVLESAMKRGDYRIEYQDILDIYEFIEEQDKVRSGE